MGLLNLLKPAPYREEIRDENIVKKKYRYWRLRTFYAMYAGYALYYLTRKSFTCAFPALQNEIGLDKSEIGFLGTVLSLSYGLSKFLSGILGDKSNPRYFMSIGLILTGIFNVFFGFSSVWWALAASCALNGWFQGWGWPGCAKLLTHWYSHSERGRWWSFWNTSHNLGGAIAPVIAAWCAEMLGWRYSLLIPGVVGVLGGFFVMDRLRDTPQSLGLPPIETFRNDGAQPIRKEKEKEQLSVKEILWEYVVTNPYIWILAFANCFIGFVRTAVNDWSAFYLVESKGYSLLEAGGCVGLFEIGGCVGSLAAGWASDIFFQGKRIPVIVLWSLCIAATVWGYQAVTGVSMWADSTFLFCVGFFIFGPQMFIGMVPAELSHKKAAATATGFVGCFAYIGAAFAGGPLGAMTKHWGWESLFLSLVIGSLVAVLLMLPFWSLKSRPQTAITQEE